MLEDARESNRENDLEQMKRKCKDLPPANSFFLYATTNMPTIEISISFCRYPV